MEETGNVSWNSQLEKVISDEGERCLCFSWLHTYAEKRYTKLNTYITLPVIILSTIAGAASIGSQVLFPPGEYGNISVGVVSLVVGGLNTVSSFFAWAKRSESHRITAITYQKVYRFILIELALPRDERMAAKDMLKIVREQCDRLQEMSPQVPDVAIKEFRSRFADTTPGVKKPEITNGLDPIYVYSSEMATPIVLRLPSAASNKPLLAASEENSPVEVKLESS
jgi:hypothetical protein